jgi:signal peptidase II
VKLRSAILIILLVIVADQGLKIYIKTHFEMGQHINLFGFNWAQLYFIENEGMAWGWKWGGDWGKMALTLFRLAAVIFGTWYLIRIVRHNYSRGFIICAALIYAGALGNLLDSMFYGMIFDKGMVYDAVTDSYRYYDGLAHFTTHGGYQSFLHGNVVDMLYFPFIENAKLPNWIPFIGGNTFTFFSPIFNIADASISVGVITLLLFQKRLVRKKHIEEEQQTVTTNSELSDQAQVM